MSRRRIVVIVVAALAAAAIFAVLVSGALPYRVFIVHTGSMSPTIPTRSAVIVQEGRFVVGQVISFEEQGGVITHRLVRINSDGSLVTRGDANGSDDPWKLSAKEVIGGVVAAPRELGYWLMYLKNPFGILSVLLSALVCWQLFSITGKREPRPSTDQGEEPIALPRHRKGSLRHARVA